MDVLQCQMVQKRKKFYRPLHLIIRRYPTYHMTTRPQWHAGSEKYRIHCGRGFSIAVTVRALAGPPFSAFRTAIGAVGSLLGWEQSMDG